MAILAQQIIALSIVLVEKLFFSLFPVVSKAFRSNKLLMGITNAFAGGVFLSAGLTHILPHAQMYFDDEVNFLPKISITMISRSYGTPICRTRKKSSPG